MTTTPALHNGLDRALDELAKLGLTRPPNVLLAEYLAALTAAELLDAERAAKVSNAYNRLRYSVVPKDDAGLRESVIALDAVAERLEVLSLEERSRVCASVQSRLSHASAPPVPPSQKPSPPPDAFPSSGGQIGSESLSDSSIESLFEPLGSRTQVVTAVPRNAPPRTRNRVPLEVCAVGALAVFFGGYIARDAADKVVKAVSFDEPGSGPRRDAWVTPARWVQTVELRGIDEVRSHHWRTARLALELALACSDEEPKAQHVMLNALAWSYLFPDEDGVTNPQRSLQLANRALQIDRQPAYLDTAALANFQLGRLSEALRLQREALVRAKDFAGGLLWSELAERLKMFEAAARRQAAPAATKTAS
jgi:hypothetical protein